mgnify:CR=1 FL=1
MSQPTWGVDAGAAAAIHQALVDLAAEDIHFAVRHGLGVAPGLQAEVLVADGQLEQCEPLLPNRAVTVPDWHFDQPSSEKALLDQLGVADAAGGRPRPRHHRCVPHGAREDRRGEAEPFVQPAHHLVQLVLDRPLLLRLDRLLGHEHLDEGAVAHVGRDTAGGGVRLGDVPVLLQPRQLVADGGGGDLQVVAVHQRAGADRRGGVDVLADDEAQDLGATTGEHARCLLLALSLREC